MMLTPYTCFLKGMTPVCTFCIVTETETKVKILDTSENEKYHLKT